MVLDALAFCCKDVENTIAVNFSVSSMSGIYTRRIFASSESGHGTLPSTQFEYHCSSRYSMQAKCVMTIVWCFCKDT